MTRHIYTLIVDCPERDFSVSTAVGELAKRLLDDAASTRHVDTGLIVPYEDGVGLRPRVVLEEVHRG